MAANITELSSAHLRRGDRRRRRAGPRRLLGRVVRAVQDDRPHPRRDRRRAAGKLRVAKLNVDENPDIARRFEVMSIPTLIVFKDGEPKKRLVGAKGKGQLLQELDEFLGSPSH